MRKFVKAAEKQKGMRKLLFSTMLLFWCSLCALGQSPYANQTSQIYYIWQNDSWVQNSKIKSVYDAKGNKTSQIEYRWQDNAWIAYAKDEYAYDAMGNLILHKGYLWQNDAWVEHSKYEYAYAVRCYKKNALGLDLGIGWSFGQVERRLPRDDYDDEGNAHIYTYDTVMPYSTIAFSVCLRYSHQFNHYFGADFIKANLLIDRDTKIQILTGVRGNTPVFGNCMSGYGALRAGYGFGWTNAVCLEAELGLNITRTFFVGMSYNLHSFNYKQHAAELRFGFNFGK